MLPDDIPLRVDSKIEFRVEVMKFIIAFRRKLVCDISHLNILPNGVYFETKRSELIQNAAKHGTITITTRLLKIRSGFYADSAMNKHGAIANTTAQGPVRSQNTEEGAVRSVPL